MELDGNTASERDGRDGGCDCCIVGAGPAGLVLACELAARGHDVVLLESGDRPSATPPAVQALNDGAVHGDDYAGLRATRHRALGGTTALWNTPVGAGVGAKYAPLDAVDLAGRPALGVGGWPIEHATLQPYYERARRLCGLGPAPDGGGEPPAPPLGDGLVPRHYQLGTRDALVGAKLQRLREAGNVRLLRNTTALRVLAGGRRATGVEVASHAGARRVVHARHVVLAGGAVENARLLLVSGDGDGALGDRSGWTGRGFMEHPRDGALLLRPTGRDGWRGLAWCDVHAAAGGHLQLGRLALDETLLAREGLPNASATLLARPAPAARLAGRWLGARGRALAGRWLPEGGHGWSRHPAPERAFDGLVVRLNLEQFPHAENRLVLGAGRDALGVPRVELHWRWRAEEQRQLDRLRATVAAALRGAGLGVVTVEGGGPPDPNAHHHAGTTRMHGDGGLGVVDADCRVHGLDNLWVSGASVFPTAGFANPVLTIVALAVRLAGRLTAEL